jgi:hypothetical protein
VAWAKYLVVFFIILALSSTTCSRKGTEPQKEYREPLSFAVFEVVPCGPPECDYIGKVHDTWEDELKGDETIKTHTWSLGDYRVFVYFHGYWASGDGSYREVLFFTDSEPCKEKDVIHSTITVYEQYFSQTDLQFSKIGTYVFTNPYHPIENHAEARDIMIAYLDQYLAEYSGAIHDSLLIDQYKTHLQSGGRISDWTGHYVHYESPGDLGGTIIVNKLTSRLDFLGSSVFGGWGRRYFPPD